VEYTTYPPVLDAASQQSTAATTTQGLMDSARLVIRRCLDPRFLS